MRSYLDFEKPVGELEQKIEELRAMQASGDVSVGDEIERLEAKAAQLITEFTPFAGARKFGDDEAIVGGFGRFQGEGVCIIGQEKGSTTESRLKHNFGMAKPEGYRKAVRLMEMADRFGIPVLALVDTAGAYPGIASEERGQAEAIARSTEAATNMKITAEDLMRFGVIDEIVPEPVGGAHRDPAAAIAATGAAISNALQDLAGLDRDAVRRQRRQKFLNIGRNL